MCCDYGNSAPGNAKDQSGFGLQVIRQDNPGPGNVGGLKGTYNRVSVKLPGWQSLAPGASIDMDFVYYLPVSTPSNWTVNVGGTLYGITGDLTRGAVDGGSPTSTPTPTVTASPTATPTVTASPTATATTTATTTATATATATATPTATPTSGACTGAPSWDAGTTYATTTKVSWKGHYYQNKWWTKGDDPTAGGAWGVWSDLGAC
ncbi:chitinase C-terminal domain-containing protein [Kitasatospora aureofaciens]|uniref:chitinase C-terminal domain-containing protein n=1 Tax=Kitasatospora aureofaciens TaxID=1894 RepID=UPI003820B169